MYKPHNMILKQLSTQQQAYFEYDEKHQPDQKQGVEVHGSKQSVVEETPAPPIENLVFEGGGVKGIVYIGALQELEKHGVFANVKRVAGSSAGGITALLLGLGYTMPELTKILSEMDFKEFTEMSNGYAFDFRVYFNAFISIFTTGRGTASGDVFSAWVIDLIEDKLGRYRVQLDKQDDAPFTFGDIEALKHINMDGELCHFKDSIYKLAGLKDMTFTGSNISANHELSTTSVR